MATTSAAHALEDESAYCGTTEAARLLGLSVATVQGMVEAGELEAWKTHGGHRRIALRSIRQVMAERPAAAAPRPGRRAQQNGPLRVMVVENDEPLRRAVGALFDEAHTDCQLHLLDSGIGALMEFSQVRPHVLISDLKLADIDGLEMLRQLRRRPEGAATLIVALSGLSRGTLEARGGLPERVTVQPKPLNTEWLRGYLTAAAHCRFLAQVHTGGQLTLPVSG